ncbi:hypothetical protein D8674_025754 [Pyrus ussuriensis x Pyrus communis]|uniref:Sulfite exporter TauE/SafE family protein 3-like n=1 Tax=Pyrus ussuriensis x Pyrus communis TaxID=2448454 RepID=A0A5N5IBX0_9ROSA|nr:hypothetical protein D8674_025754 [Pyrus ussuriensis x Pyrus communis]
MISMIGKRKSSFGQASLRSRKSTQTRICPNFLRTMAMLEIHLGYCTSRIASISLSISTSISGISLDRYTEILKLEWLILSKTDVQWAGLGSSWSCSMLMLTSCFKGAEMWKEETILKKEYARQQEATLILINAEYESLLPSKKKPMMQILMFNLRWKKVLVLVAVWNDVNACGTWYWVLFCLESTGITESICEASIAWPLVHIAFCALCGILGGTVRGLLGSGGGFILGPLLLEIGVIPQVASVTAIFVMTFSSSLSAVEFYLLKRFPIPYAIYLTSMSILVGFWGQASIIVFILSGVIFASAITMGVISIKTSIQMIANHEFMRFLEFCSSQ